MTICDKIMLTMKNWKGNVYLPFDELFMDCVEQDQELSRKEFCDGIAQLVQDGQLEQEEDRLYIPKVRAYEDTVAGILAELLSENRLPHTDIPEVLAFDDVVLTEEQREAVSLALDYRLSIIQGGAGTGKSTLIQAIVQQYDRAEGPVLLCAPTGKAACNLRERTGFRGNTIHGAFESAFRDGLILPYGLVIVDEAGMVSLEMLAWILSTLRPSCRVVLVGDPNQLPPVDCGRVMEDLLELGVPHILLTTCHRQADTEGALSYNVCNFDRCFGMGDLSFDASFMFFPQKNEKRMAQYLCKAAASLYQEGQNVQVLSPYGSRGLLSAAALNQRLQALVNPREGEKMYPLHDGDRVMVIQNDWTQNVCNGETGVLHLLPREGQEPLYQVTCGDRQAIYNYDKVLRYLALAYAATVHKAQGSEYDTVLFPVSKSFAPLLTRNLFYTAISRAKRRVILVGDSEALSFALKNFPAQRYSMLAGKVEQLCLCRV